MSWSDSVGNSETSYSFTLFKSFRLRFMWSESYCVIVIFNENLTIIRFVHLPAINLCMWALSISLLYISSWENVSKLTSSHSMRDTYFLQLNVQFKCTFFFLIVKTEYCQKQNMKNKIKQHILVYIIWSQGMYIIFIDRHIMTRRKSWAWWSIHLYFTKATFILLIIF